MPPPDILLIPALLILCLDHIYEAWRWLRIALRRASTRRVIVTILLCIIAVSHLIVLTWHTSHVTALRTVGPNAARVA